MIWVTDKCRVVTVECKLQIACAHLQNLTVLTLCEVFSCTLLISNNMISLIIWWNKHLERLQIAFDRWVYAILSLKNLLNVLINNKLHSKSCNYLYSYLGIKMKFFCPYLVEPQSQRIPVSNKKPLSDVKLHSINQQWPFCKKHKSQ